jgi:polyhydroxybutyrate depolymerase
MLLIHIFLLLFFLSVSNASTLVDFDSTTPNVYITKNEEGLFLNWSEGAVLQKSNSISGPWEQIESENNQYYVSAEEVESSAFFRALNDSAIHRPSTLHIPDDFDGISQLPLFINLHGWAVDGMFHDENRLPLSRFVDARKFYYVAPDGLPDPAITFMGSQPRGWNATDGCCASPVKQQTVDDVEFIVGLVSWISENYPVDPARIFITGHSNGGFMVHRMLCERSDIFAAGVSHAGLPWADESFCNPSEKVSILQIHSLQDEIIPYFGEASGAFGGPTPSVPGALQAWADKLGCDGSLRPVGERLDLDLDVPGAETFIFVMTAVMVLT